ncbi:MAG: OmpA family protein [Mariprofundaceae bacterium]|nr:OmpA family protein [Mariprofundaceae bacterium]
MAREKKPDPIPAPKDPGAALFLELMMQMLAFFILLTSIAVIVDEKRLAALGSLAGTFSPMPRGANLSKGEGPSMPSRDITDGRKAPKRTAKALTDISKALGSENAIHVLQLDQENVQVRMSQAIAFEPGKVTLAPSAAKLMDELAVLFAKPEVIEVMIQGHTDETPTRGSLYDSNWELSSARAMAVFTALSDRGVPNSRMVAAGMGDQHPLTLKGKDLSRRVEINLKFRPVTDENEETGGGKRLIPVTRPAVAPKGLH